MLTVQEMKLHTVPAIQNMNWVTEINCPACHVAESPSPPEELVSLILSAHDVYLAFNV